jgi:hypothetical protein
MKKVIKYPELLVNKVYMKVNGNGYLMSGEIFIVTEITSNPEQKKIIVLRPYIIRGFTRTHYIPGDKLPEFIEIGSVE